LKEILLNSDLIVAACGIPQFVKKEMVSPNTVLIDVGINYIEGEGEEETMALVGDIAYKEVL
jgi:methylenetetrahydrofolate dehydrogenase (NADP+)/methenyltetrahydrofolate cyclohydrolase/formyltetrahydrofolate synthetase